MIEKNQRAKFFFKNGMTAEGTIESWTEQLAILKSVSNDILYIFNVSENVLMVKILQPEPAQAQLELPNFEPDPGLRAQKLADLKIMQQKALKEKIAQKLNTWELTSAPVTYEHPNFSQRSPMHHSSSQGSGLSSGNLTKLSKLFRKPSQTR